MSTSTDAPLLAVEHLVKRFPVGPSRLGRQRRHVEAVSDVSFAVDRGETLALVGESGSGKSTLIRTTLRLTEPSSGSIDFDGRDLTQVSGRELRAIRRDVQIVFQDPYAALNPRWQINTTLGERHRLDGRSGRETRQHVSELLELVGLKPEHANRYPHEFSGGQRQRIGIARALSTNPKLIALDEPVSALDVSIQAGILNLLRNLQQHLGVAYVFVSHDLAVVRHVAHRVAVMYLGKIVETGTREQIYANPAHPYTQALLAAVPQPDPRRERARERSTVRGDLPSPLDPPSGCRFRTRCPHAVDGCATQEPLLVDRGDGHRVACHLDIARRTR